MAATFLVRRSAAHLLVLVLLAVSQACSPSAGGGQPTPGQSEVTVSKDITWGPGPFSYPDPRTGLADLTSYGSKLTASFSGTRDGSTETWSRTYSMLAANEPLARQWHIESSSNGSAPEVIFHAESNGMDYEKHGDAACVARTSDPTLLLSDHLELTSFLDAVIGAEEVGSETVNEIEATHYTFDQRALGQDGLTEANGELWVAVDGGYLVKYLLTSKAGPDFFGKGLDGTLTVDYELTAPNAPVEISLPDDCPPGLIAAPTLPDATDISSLPGVLSFHSSTSIADAAAFYQKELPPLGWIDGGDAAISDTSTALTFTKEGQAMIVTIDAADQGSTVTIFVGPNQDFGF
jgi:hypothetical protein